MHTSDGAYPLIASVPVGEGSRRHKGRRASIDAARVGGTKAKSLGATAILHGCRVTKTQRRTVIDAFAAGDHCCSRVTSPCSTSVSCRFSESLSHVSFSLGSVPLNSR